MRPKWGHGTCVCRFYLEYPIYIRKQQQERWVSLMQLFIEIDIVVWENLVQSCFKGSKDYTLFPFGLRLPETIGFVSCEMKWFDYRLPCKEQEYYIVSQRSQTADYAKHRISSIYWHILNWLSPHFDTEIVSSMQECIGWIDFWYFVTTLYQSNPSRSTLISH